MSTVIILFRNGGKYLGAGYQCRSSRVWLDFVPCLGYVQHMSPQWLEYVPVLYVTSICLQNQAFDFIKSSVCPAGPTFVLILSPDFEQISRKNWGQNLDKNRTSSFFNLPSSHPSPGQKLDNLWTLRRLKFVHLLSKHILSYLCPSLVQA